MAASHSKGPTLQQGALVGIVILALAAVLLAWLDQSGVFEMVVWSLEHAQY